MVSAELSRNNITAVLVGGACVSIYSHNKYESIDLDYVTHTPVSELKNVMNKLGFFQKSSRHFEHPKCPFFIEFPSPPVAIGHEFPIKKFKSIKSLKLLTPTDSVKDRLAAYYHWNDPQSLDQALMVAKYQKINLRRIKKWSVEEKFLEKFERFRSLLKNT